MTPEDKIANIEAQFVLMEHGEINTFSCPYCAGISAQGEAFCCPLMMKAVAAILDRHETEDRMRMAEEIAEQADKQLVTLVN